MFKVMGLQPGDGLKLEVSGKQSGIPTTRLTIIPAGALCALLLCAPCTLALL